MHRAKLKRFVTVLLWTIVLLHADLLRDDHDMRESIVIFLWFIVSYDSANQQTV